MYVYIPPAQSSRGSVAGALSASFVRPNNRYTDEHYYNKQHNINNSITNNYVCMYGSSSSRRTCATSFSSSWPSTYHPGP